MSLYVLKFGGSSVATPTRIKHVSEIVSKLVSEGHRVVVVTSAMQGVTNQLIDLTKSFSDSSFNREYDAVVSSGEQVAAGLLALSLNSIGLKAKSLNAWQVPIKITGEFSNATISDVDEKKLINDINHGIIPVITGFQGISKNGDIKTIGRGGSDATACAVSKAIDADECLIYTDVDGVYSADPRIVLSSKRILEVSYGEMIELATNGAKVLQAKSTLIAKQYEVNLRVLSSFSEGTGTKITKKTDYVSKHNIAGIAHDLNLFLLKFSDFIDFKDILEKTRQFEPILLSTDSFLFPKSSKSELKSLLNNLDFSFDIDNDIGVVTIVGEGIGKNEFILDNIKSNAENYSLKIKEISISKISISVIVPFQQTELFVNILHKCFFED